jgi:uncharacterized protein YbjT (DUF2867 family)
MNIVVTGGTGFTGSNLVPLLLERGHRVRCLVRETSDRTVLPQGDIVWAVGDLGDVESLRSAFSGMDALANVASIGFGHAPNIVSAALSVGIKRAVFISTTAIFTTLNAPSKAIRLEAEEKIRKSGVAYTIIRPTMIYGSSRDRNMCRLINYLNKAYLMPVLGSGENKQQPVYVGDVAKAVADCLEEEKAVGNSYNIPGQAPLSFNEIIDTISRLLRRRVRRIHLPASPVIAAFSNLEKFGLRLPIKAEQIMRLNEDKAFDYGQAERDFGYAPLSFEKGIITEIREMGLRVFTTSMEDK